jgi:hypothetical protein
MTDRSGSMPLSRPQREMLAHVEALLGRHPKLQPLLESGWRLELACDDVAIWVTATAAAGGEPASARMQTPRWWLPSRSGRALAIAEALATSLVEGVDTTR